MKPHIVLLLGVFAFSHQIFGVDCFSLQKIRKRIAAPFLDGGVRSIKDDRQLENASLCPRTLNNCQYASIQSDQSGDGKKLLEISKEIIGVGVWIVAVSSFILANHFAGPWPAGLDSWFPYSVWLLMHALAGMVFSGGIVITTLIEWMVVGTATKKNDSGDNILPVLKFWFDQVPTLDLAVVVPALTVAMFSGTGLTSVKYGYLGHAPLHVTASLHALVTFAIWWATTDLTTQGAAREALIQMQQDDSDQVPRVLLFRRISNVVSCTFVLVLYGLMILKPGS